MTMRPYLGIRLGTTGTGKGVTTIFSQVSSKYRFWSEPAKGQVISKCHFGVFNSFPKRTKTIQLEVVVKSNFFVHFLVDLKIPKINFEIK